MITILLQRVLAALTQLLGDIKTKLNTIKDNLDDLIVVATASGPIASFTTTITKPFISCNVEIKPKQASGTPTPSSPLPISGTDTVIITQTGANLANIKPFADWVVKKSYLCNSADLPRKRTKLVFIDNDTSVSLSGINFGFFDTSWDGITNINSSQYRWVINNGVIQSEKRNIPTTNDTTIFLDGLFIYPNTEAAFNAVFARYKIMVIPENSTATTYEPYSATTKTVSLPETVYGGEVDVIGGSGTKKFGVVDLGDLNWLRYSPEGTNIPVFYAGITDTAINKTNGLCEIFKVKAWEPLTSRTDMTLCPHPTIASIYVADSDYTTVADFKAAVSGYKYIYELATPTPITLANPIELTALAGVNNVFGDTDGNTSVEYLKLYKEE